MAAYKYKMEIIRNEGNVVEERHYSNSLDYLYSVYRKFFMTGGELNCRALSHHCKYYDDKGHEYNSIYDMKNHIVFD